MGGGNQTLNPGEAAIADCVSKGIIASPEYWAAAYNSPQYGDKMLVSKEYFAGLLRNAAGKIR